MKNKVEIIPAILPKTFKEVEEGVAAIQGFVKSVQIDICDGKFTSEASWPYKKHDDSFEIIVREEQGLPYWEKLDYEFDLMVDNSSEVIDDWIAAGAARIIIHVESKNVAETINKIGNRVEIGLALNIETPISVIEPFKEKIKFVQCMGIRRIGFQGQTFDDEVIGKIKEIKSKYPNLLISVDGGVSLVNAESIIAAGVDRLVVGSAIFGSENVIDTINKFMDYSNKKA
jgi:ribulose-phosphate 3-epimerase